MPRLLTANDSLEAVNSRSWHERSYEDLVVYRSAQIFPRWTCVPFAVMVQDDDGVRHKPDLALVDIHYRGWWVVEVELAHHSLRGHVIPQVQTFQNGIYGTEHAEALQRSHPEFEIGRLQAMMLGEPPKVLVIVDSPSVVEEWQMPLRALTVGLCIVEPFRSRGTDLIFRLNGVHPEPPGDSLSRCSRHRLMRRLWKVHSPATLPIGADSLSIEYRGIVSEWNRVNIRGGVLLQSTSGDVLEDLTLVDLIKRTDGSLAFQEVLQNRPRRNA